MYVYSKTVSHIPQICKFSSVSPVCYGLNMPLTTLPPKSKVAVLTPERMVLGGEAHGGG